MTPSVEQFREAIRLERLSSLRAARALSDACASGDVDGFLCAVDALRETADGWRLAMRRVGRLASVSGEIQDAFLRQWIEHKFLPQTVRHRPTMAAALRILLPRNYNGPPLLVYRGTRVRERRRRLYGFSCEACAWPRPYRP